MSNVRNPIDPFLLALVDDSKVQNIHTILKDPSFTEAIAKRLATNTGQSFLCVSKIKSVSQGLVVSDRTVSLYSSLGVALSSSKQPFIKTPENIRFRGGYTFVCSNDLLNTNVCVTDANFNILGPLGSYGLTYSSGQYSSATDATVSHGSVLGDRLYVCSETDHIVQVYNREDFSFLKTIGTGGISGADGLFLSNPVAVAVGTNPVRLYVLSSTGTPTGATGPGHLTVYKTSSNTFDSIPIFCGKNNGGGLCIQGEIKNPKDMCIVSGTTKDAKDDIFILNGVADEVGRFDSETYKLKDVYRMPLEYNGVSLGLKRIAVKDNILYITASSIGKVLAIDIHTKAFLGSFGLLRSETSGMGEDTLGFFNGLSGITLIQDKIVVSEALNNRIQVLTPDLFQKEFSVTFHPVNLPPDKKLIDITYSLSGDLDADIVIVDPENDQEYDIRTAISLGMTNFSVRMKISPFMFSKSKRKYDIFPIYILLEA